MATSPITKPDLSGAEPVERDDIAARPSLRELRQHRRQLWDEREFVVYHLGGLAIELRRRGLHAPELIDNRLERVLELERSIAELDLVIDAFDRHPGRVQLPVTDLCPTCGATHPFDAAFCAKCGTRLGGSLADDVTPDDQPTMTIEMEMPPGDAQA